MDSDCHVMRFRLIQETKVYNVEDDVARMIHQTLGGGRRAGHGGCLPR